MNKRPPLLLHQPPPKCVFWGGGTYGRITWRGWLLEMQIWGVLEGMLGFCILAGAQWCQGQVWIPPKTSSEFSIAIFLWGSLVPPNLTFWVSFFYDFSSSQFPSWKPSSWIPSALSAASFPLPSPLPLLPPQASCSSSCLLWSSILLPPLRGPVFASCSLQTLLRTLVTLPSRARPTFPSAQLTVSPEFQLLKFNESRVWSTHSLVCFNIL